MKKIFCSVIVLVSVLLGVFALPSCTATKEKYTSYSFDYFDTMTSVTGYAESREAFDEIYSEIELLLKEYHQLFTIYDRYEGINNLLSINELKDGAHLPVKVDQKIIDMLSFAKEMYEKTDGKVNIAMGSVLSIWHEYREEGISLPPMDELVEASAHMDINDLIIDKEASTVFLKDPKMSLDVGAVAKGYAAEKIAQHLIKKGITGYVINIGGNVRAIGTHADGRPWATGIEDPNANEDEPYYVILDIEDLSLVTSGTYQRFYTVDGKNHHHIISPDTLMPTEMYTSVSILCESSAVADALSTALFCMDIDEGKRVIESFDDVEAMWVRSNGEIIYSDGFLKYKQGDKK